jgi:hypothetical protein
MAYDVTAFTDDELDTLPDLIGREKSRRWNVVEAPKRVEELTTALADRPNLSDVVVEEDVDGAWVTVDLSGIADPDAALKSMEGVQIVSTNPLKVRHGGSAFTKEGGHFDTLEASM